MNPNTLIVVCAYSGDLDQVRNNMPVYQHHKCPVVVMSPTDAPVTSEWSSVDVRHVGLKGWIGPQTLIRQKLMMEEMLKFSFEYFFAHDADSLCLSPEIPKYLYDNPEACWANVVTDTNPGESLLPKVALQPPYFFSRRVIEKMVSCFDHLPTSYTSGRTPEGWPLPAPNNCIDHLILQMACGGGVPFLNFHTGASFETNSDHGAEVMAGLVRDYGKTILHSIKKPEVLTRLSKERKTYCLNHGIRE